MELSISEAAALLGRSPRTLRAQVARGELPGVKRGSQWFVLKSALPLTESQRDALQHKADALRGTLEEALPARLARSAGQHHGLADLDAFRHGAVLLRQMRATDPTAVPEIDLARASDGLERALLGVAEASAQYDRGRGWWRCRGRCGACGGGSRRTWRASRGRTWPGRWRLRLAWCCSDRPMSAGRWPLSGRPRRSAARGCYRSTGGGKVGASVAGIRAFYVPRLAGAAGGVGRSRQDMTNGRARFGQL